MINPLSGHLYSYNFRRMRSNNNRTATAKLYGFKQFARNHDIKDGFPINDKFTDLEDIELYFSADEIVCLLCGKQKKTLAAHLAKIHGWTVEKYQLHYNLPVRTGLCGKATRERKKAIGKSLFESGRGLAALSPSEAAEYRKSAHDAIRQGKIRNSGNILTSKKNLSIREWTDGDFDALLKAMVEQDRGYAEVTGDHPKSSAIRAKCRKDSAFDARLKAATEALSFKAQSRCQSLGVRAYSEAARLIAAGLTHNEIANRWGITQSGVSLLLLRGPKNGHFKRKLEKASD